jgi:hypothetical protein
MVAAAAARTAARAERETTETTQVRELLDSVGLENAVVTADAAHAQDGPPRRGCVRSDHLGGAVAVMFRWSVGEVLAVHVRNGGRAQECPGL